MAPDRAFGQQLKERRKALDLTREELAQRVGCAVSTIRKLEIDARRPSRQIAERLAVELQIPPEERAAFVRLARAAAPEQLPAAALPTGKQAAASKLPAQLTPLIGRARETAAVCTVLAGDDVRLLTLLGPPGVGKTRLALQVAADLRGEFADGVVWIPLAPLRDAGLVAAAVAQALDVSEAGSQPLLERLQQRVRSAELLLVLDNFEQLSDAAPLLAALLGEAPGVKALVTSRVPLHIYGEHEYAVPPLGLPPASELGSPERLAGYEAVRLFVARAQAVSSEFAPTAGNARALADICIRLDGLPLAIELAAARIKQFAPHALLQRLAAPLSVLTGGPRDRAPRQQTLRDAIGWSYELLDAHEQALFRRLGVFVGGCTLEAVEKVASSVENPEPAFLNAQSSILDSLVDKSLVQQESDAQGEPRYTMLEVILEYARERLAAHGETERAEQAHAQYFMALAETAEPRLTGAQEADWVRRLGAEHDNLRAALMRCPKLAGGAAVALRIAAALGRFWRVRSFLSEGRARLADALALAPPTPELAEVRAKAIGMAGWLAFVQGDYASAQRLFEQSLALYRELGSTDGIIRILNRLAATASFAEDYAAARGHLEEALALAERLGDSYLVGNTLNGLGEIARLENDYPRARGLYEASLAIKRAAGEQMGTAVALHNLARVALYQADVDTAAACFGESLAVFTTLESQLDMAMCVAGLAGVAAARGQVQTAARWLGAAGATLDQLGAAVWPADRAAYDQDLAAVRATLAPDTFAAARAEGRAMTLAQAVAEALAPGT